MAIGDTNINIGYSNFCRGPRLGTFSYINTDSDYLQIRNESGAIQATYNLDTSLEGTLIGFDYAGPADLTTEYDDLPFYTLERISSSSCKIKRWYINTNTLTLDLNKTITKSSSGTDYYDALAGAIEFYRRSFAISTASGVNVVRVNSGTRIDSGMKLYLGPNNLSESEWVTVDYRSGQFVYLTSSTLYEYALDDGITALKHYYIVSDLGYAGDPNKGTIFKLDANTGTKVDSNNSGEYQSVSAAAWSSTVEAVACVNGTNLTFIRPYASYQIWKSMFLNNIESNGKTLIDVHDVAFYGNVVYKLMQKVTGRDDDGNRTTYDWSPNYNFHADTLLPYSNSVDISTDKQVLIGTSEATTIYVKVVDQFNVGLNSVTVTVGKDGGDPGGSFFPADGVVTTDSNGETSVQYTSGTNYNNFTTITAKAGGGSANNGSSWVWNFFPILSRIDAPGQSNIAEYYGNIYCFGDNPKLALSTADSDADTLEVVARIMRQVVDTFESESKLFCRTYFTSPGGDWENPSSYANQATTYLSFLVLGDNDGPQEGFSSGWNTSIDDTDQYIHVNAIKQIEEFESEGYAYQIGDEYTVPTVTSGVAGSDVTISGAKRVYSEIINQLEVPDGELQISQLKGSYHTFWVDGVAYDNVFTNVELNQFIFVEDAIPAFFSKKNPKNTDIWIRLRPFAFSLNSSTLVFKVREVSYDGDTGYTDVASSCVVTTFDAGGGVFGLDILYDPPEDFHYDARVYVFIELYDSAPTPNYIYVAYWFDIVPDLRFPYLDNLNPDRNETDVGVDTNVYFEIKDDGSGVDIDTLELYVDNRYVVPSTTKISRTHYTVEYNPTQDFLYGKEIQIGVIVSDIIGNTLNTSYRFYTEDSDPPWFVPISPRICQYDMRRFEDVELLALSGDGGIDLGTIRIQLHGMDVTEDVNFLPIVYRQGPENPNIGPSLEMSDLSLTTGDYISNSGSLYVDITDNIFDVTTSGCYFAVNGTVVSGTTFSGITDGFRMTYDPADDFESFWGTTILTAHAESGSTVSGIYTKEQQLDSDFYLTFGYHARYDNSKAAGVDLGYDEQVIVRVEAENDVSCPTTDAFAYWFKTNTNLPQDLRATIVGLTEEGYFRGEKDLSAKIYPQSTAFQYGKDFTVVVTAKDFSGNEMPPYVLTFKIEDKP